MITDRLRDDAIFEVLNAAEAWTRVPVGTYAPTTKKEKWDPVTVTRTDYGRRVAIEVTSWFGRRKKPVTIFDITNSNGGGIQGVCFTDNLAKECTVHVSRIGNYGDNYNIIDHEDHDILRLGIYDPLKLRAVRNAARRSYPVKSVPQVGR